jgi:hypothetical protein
MDRAGDVQRVGPKVGQETQESDYRNPFRDPALLAQAKWRKVAIGTEPGVGHAESRMGMLGLSSRFAGGHNWPRRHRSDSVCCMPVVEIPEAPMRINSLGFSGRIRSSHLLIEERTYLLRTGIGYPPCICRAEKKNENRKHGRPYGGLSLDEFSFSRPKGD